MDFIGTIEEALRSGLDLSKMFEQELGNLALTAGPVSAPVSSASPGVLLNRVPPGYTAVLINLEQCSRSELRSFLHNRLCEPQLQVGGNGCGPPKRLPLSQCKCQMLEFDHQPDFMFGKRKHTDSNEHDDDDEGDEDASDESDNDDNMGHDTEDEHSSYAVDGVPEVYSGDDQAKLAGGPRPSKIEIKRPANAFIIFRSEHHNETVKRHKGGNKVVSRILANAWRALPAEEKRRYKDMAAARKREHELLYPNYKFTPRRRRT
ncbi:hypothetical protein H4R19_002109 [Coemansia spiralis]|nr:hypothetical protein H4R19_002109 [Coemansia spiralis]